MQRNGNQNNNSHLGTKNSFPNGNGVISTAPDTKNGVKVCLVDDDPSVLKATARLLSSAGWEVETFSDPASFLKYAQQHSPRVAVVDILMPTMDGLEVQQRLRDLSPSTRVIIMTSNDDPAVRSKAMGAGASAFFLKPVKDDQFLAHIQSAYSNN
jgi:FixJ family two-component response regulator